MTCSAYGQTNKHKQFLVVSLEIKQHLFYDSCVLERNIFNTAPCFTLHFDTIKSRQKIYLKSSKLVFDLDSLHGVNDFSIIHFWTSYNFPGSEKYESHYNSCFTAEDVRVIKDLGARRGYLEDLKLSYNSGNSGVSFKTMRFYIKD
jgi:hypothetical protein